jgi:hypothetical protein
MYKANSSKEKAKLELFSKNSVLELNTTKLGNSPSFLTITHMTPFAKRFRSYRILTINITAEFCFWTEQQLAGIKLLGFGLTETLETPNTITVVNSLRFLMLHKMAPNGRRFVGYGCRKLDRFAESEFWADLTFLYKSGF